MARCSIRFRLCAVAGIVAVAAWIAPCGRAAAAVVVIANRTADTVRFQVEANGMEPLRVTLDAGDVRPVSVRESVETVLTSDQGRRFQLAPYAVYYFGRLASGQMELHEIGLGARDVVAALPTADPPILATGPTAAGAPPNAAPTDRPRGVLPVKILVDEEERAKRNIWENRLRKRIAAASAILKRHCGIKLEVVAVDTWRTSDRIAEFDKSVREFELRVDPSPARLAIGFASQYELVRGRTHLGGTRGPLSSHVLVREWSQHISEAERLEVLVHEVGHVLGAVHSPEQESVMRPILGDKQARARSFRIGFDPVNTLAMCLLGEEIRERDIRSFAEISPGTRERLRKVYAELARALPTDPAAGHYMKRLGAK